jgi:hypothetical protein
MARESDLTFTLDYSGGDRPGIAPGSLFDDPSHMKESSTSAHE